MLQKSEKWYIINFTFLDNQIHFAHNMYVVVKKGGAYGIMKKKFKGNINMKLLYAT